MIIRKTINYLLIALLALSFGLSSCDDSDKFSSDASNQLTFSTTTLDFDTVFTKQVTRGKEIMIYNKNNKSLRIQSIELLDGASSAFRINVDGHSGTSFTDIEVLKKDSIYVFVDVLSDEVSGLSNLESSLRIVCNGNESQIKLKAIGLDVDVCDNLTIENDTIISGTKPIHVKGELRIAEGAIVTIEAGATLYFDTNANLKIDGKLIAEGTLTKPIVFRGDRFGKNADGIAYDNIPSQWLGITVSENSFGNSLDYVLIKNGRKGLLFDKSTTIQRKAVLKNTIIRNMAEHILRAENCNIDATNCLFANSGRDAMILDGGKYSFLHCTLVNYYRWNQRGNRTLTVSNNSASLEQCLFENSIVYGSFNNEINWNKSNSFTYSYLFTNCVLKTETVENSFFPNTIWNEYPGFEFMNEDDSFNYSYRLLTGSPAIGKGSMDGAVLAPTDLLGKTRNVTPDIGCYEGGY